jgi:hypothetical protein
LALSLFGIDTPTPPFTLEPMAERGGTQIPWASLAVVVAFVSSTVLVPKAFEILRPPERDRAQAYSGANLEVDARLWEDPFAAVRRHEADRKERCNSGNKEARECDKTLLAWRRSPQMLRNQLDGNNDGEIDVKETLLMAVLVPGNPFVGAEESRRRTRFALLAGLQAEGYFSDSAEQIGLLQLPMAPLSPFSPLVPFSATAPASSALAAAAAKTVDWLQLPYELLSRNRDVRAGGEATTSAVAEAASGAQSEAPAGAPSSAKKQRHFERVAVVWVDESALPGPKLDGVARLMDTVIHCREKVCPRLVVIGPSSSDGLNTALDGLDIAMKRRIQGEEVVDESLANGYRLLGNAHFYSPSATISEQGMTLLRRYGLSLQEFLDGRFAGIVPERGQLKPEERAVRFVRTVADDDVVASLLAAEVLQRLPVGRCRRVVTLVESDSIYARGLEKRFRLLLGQADQGGDSGANQAPCEEEPWYSWRSIPQQIKRVDQAYFFRGMDGVTLRDGAERPAPAGKATGNSAGSAVEWPEARDQLDYLRRMAEDLKRSESAQGRGPIGAIGIFANDVHDKLLVLQALHDTFPDKVFFTTDMDARFVHPRALPFTRNLVVASSLPLQFPVQLTDGKDGSVRMANRQLQEGTPPLRDMYQTATYLAARMAACLRRCEAVRDLANAALASPSVYEIGRSSAVAVDGFDAKAQRHQHPGRHQGWALGFGLLVLAAALLGWPSTPALRHARTRWLQGPGAAPAQEVPVSRMASLLCVGYGLWLGFAAASVQEASAPLSLGLNGALCWALLGGLAALVLLVPWRGMLGPAPSAQASLTAQLGSFLRLAAQQAAPLAALLAAAIQLTDPAQLGHGEPLLWLEGISAWPSHFLNLLALLTVLLAMDFYWQQAARLNQSEVRWLSLPVEPLLKRVPQPDDSGSPALFKLQDWLARYSLLAWRLPAPGPVEFNGIWQRYQQLSGPWPRVLRVIFWYGVTLFGAFCLFVVFSDNYVPEVPVRGAEHYKLVRLGLTLAMFASPALVVAVADTTMATVRFMAVLNNGRTQYPAHVVARFARELGAEHQALLAAPIAADPGQRGSVDANKDTNKDANQAASDAANADLNQGARPASSAHSLLDDWIDIQVVARQTKVVGLLIVAPFVVLAVMVLARSRLFDNWAMTWPIALTAAVYLLWLVGLAVALKISAEKLRTNALQRMQADLRWLGGAGGGRDKLVEPFKRLISAVENNTTGAFAATFDQPLVTSLMVPLGGAGGAQLLDYVLLAR